MEKENLEKKVIKNNRKGDLLLILGLVVVAVLGFFLMKEKEVEPSYKLPLTLSGDPGLKQLTYAEYQEKIDNDEQFVIILERATCSHCVTYMPIAEKFAKDNSYLRKSNGKWGTPTTVVLAGSESVSYIEGSTTADELVELYNEYFDTNLEV